MSPPRSPTRSSEKVEAILDAALKLFVERGFHGTAVPDLARRAGIAAGTIYYYFSGKEALVNALYRRWKQAVASAIYTAFPTDAPPRRQFSVIWREMASFAMANPEAFAFLEFHHHRSYLDAESLRLEQSLKAFGATFVQRAQEQGVVKPMEPMLLMELVFGAFSSMIRAHHEHRIDLTDEALEAAEEACWDAVSVRPR